MAVVGEARSYYKRFLFSIEIDGLDVAWFTTCSAIVEESGVVEQHEGGLIRVADQSPGKTKFEPVTLTIGATDNDELYNWRRQVSDAAANSGQPDEQYKRNVSVVQRDRDGSERKRWNLFKAWPSKFTAGEWDAKAEENVMQEIVLTYLYFEKG